MFKCMSLPMINLADLLPLSLYSPLPLRNIETFYSLLKMYDNNFFLTAISCG